MKKSTFGLIATAAMLFTPVAALAQDAQQNLQINRADAASAVGEYNLVNQGATQVSGQTNTDIEYYGHYYGY